MSSWDVPRAKATLRLAAQRLGQLRDRMDAQAPMTGRDISILLQQGNTTLARAKAQKLIKDDIMGNLLELLEMQIGVLLERLSELEGGSPSPSVIEAASSIIYAAPQVETKDLGIVRDLLVQRLGATFLHSAITNKDGYVSPKVVRAISASPASAAELDRYLAGIAKSHGVAWQPELRPDDVLHALSEILDADSSPTVDMPQLRRLCAHGIPSSPPWLRPRIWRILLGTLPVLKSNWEKEAKKQRDSYYDLLRRLLEPFSDLPPPATPLASLDAQLTNSIKDLFRVPANLLAVLEEEPEGSSFCPLDPNGPDDIRIACALNLDARLAVIHARDTDDSQNTPEIRLEGDSYAIPEINLQAPEAEDEAEAEETGSKPSKIQTTLLLPRVLNTGSAHSKHASALIRLLYIHSCLNPANHSPHMASLLVPLYAVLNEEVEPKDQAHIEADTFWLFEAVVSEFSELEDQDGGNRWMKKFGERVAWADAELSSDLTVKGLDPSLPHYSYRWLAPLLTHTLPLPSVLSIWDALFSRAMTARDTCPKLEYLLDICTSMLLRAKGPLLRLGKSGRRSPGLWHDESGSMPPPSPVRAWELNDAFIEGMALLQMFPIEAAGGVESILQTAAELASKREQQMNAPKVSTSTLGSRIANTMWRGFTNQVSSPASSPETSDAEDTAAEETDKESDHPAANSSALGGLTTSWSNTVWKGITNQSAMEAPPSPLSPASPLTPVLPSPAPRSPDLRPNLLSPSASSTSSLWSYAEKLRESDTAAAFAKVSTNWRVKALEAWQSRGTAAEPQTAGATSSLAAVNHPRSGSFDAGPHSRTVEDDRRSSLPGMDRSQIYSPPARPKYFRPPRDSMLPQPRRSPLASPTSPGVELSPEEHDAGPANSIRKSIASLTGFTSSSAPKPAPKSGPRPLLLSSSSLLTGSSTSSASRSTKVTPSIGAHHRDWSDVLQSRPHLNHKTSASSISSASEARGRHLRTDTRGSDWESDATESRKVSINRGSVSPMAPIFRQSRPTSERSFSGNVALQRSWSRVDAPDSPVTLPSSPPPPTPESSRFPSSSVQVGGAESQRGSMVLSESNVHVLDTSARKIIRKKTPPPAAPGDETSDSSAAPIMTPSRSPRTRSKRYVNRPTNLTIHRHDANASATSDTKTPSPNSLQLPEGPDDVDTGMTPRALTFDSSEHQLSSPSPPSPSSPTRIRKLSGDGRARKLSSEGQPVRTRKISADGRVIRPRKVSNENRENKRESRAVEGDDEGYDDLLSAYSESEGNGTDTGHCRPSSGPITS